MEPRVTRVRNNTNHHADPAHRNLHGLRCCPSEFDAKDIDGRFSESATIHSLVFSRLTTTVRARVCVCRRRCAPECARLERPRRARLAPAQPATRPSRPRPAPSPVATPAPARDGQARVHPRIGRSSSVASGRLITPVQKTKAKKVTVSVLYWLDSPPLRSARSLRVALRRSSRLARSVVSLRSARLAHSRRFATLAHEPSLRSAQRPRSASLLPLLERLYAPRASAALRAVKPTAFRQNGQKRASESKT